MGLASSMPFKLASVSLWYVPVIFISLLSVDLLPQDVVGSSCTLAVPDLNQLFLQGPLVLSSGEWYLETSNSWLLRYHCFWTLSEDRAGNNIKIYIKIYVFLNHEFRNPLAVHWLGLGAFTAGAHVQSLVGELRSHKPCGTAKTNKQTTMNLYRYC